MRLLVLQRSACRALIAALGAVVWLQTARPCAGQGACTPDSYSILMPTHRQRLGLDQPDGQRFYSSRSYAQTPIGELLSFNGTGELRRLDGTIAVAPPASEPSGEGLFMVDGELYLAAQRVWRLQGGSWENVGGDLPPGTAPGPVTAIASRGGRLLAAKGRQVYEIRAGLWRSVVDGGAVMNAATELPVSVRSLVVLGGTLIAGTESNAGGVPGIAAPPTSCLWRLEMSGWQPVCPELIGVAGTLVEYQSRLYVSGIMRLPDSPARDYIFLASVHDGVCEPIVTYASPLLQVTVGGPSLTPADGRLYLSGLPAPASSPSRMIRGVLSFDGATMRDEFPGVQNVSAVLPLLSGTTALGVASLPGAVSARQSTLFRFGTPPAPVVIQQTLTLSPASANASRTMMLKIQTAAGAPPAQVQWRRNGTAIQSGQTSWRSALSMSVSSELPYVMTERTHRLTIDRMRTQDAGMYDAVISTPCGVTGSESVQLRVCVADFDASGDVTTQDLLGFLDAWFALRSNADIDASPGVGVSDLFEFLGSYFGGCP